MNILSLETFTAKQEWICWLEHLPEIKQTHKPHFIIANAENAANGRGINQNIYKALMQAGIHVLTMGNWVWGNQELKSFIDASNIISPINFRNAPGEGYKVFNFNGKKLLVVNALR
jgi:2',3'-cyclic-nucleotide 2'-phosphodiesterase